jgi:FK506-binding protein 1
MGLEIETITPGDGKNFPQKGATVKAHYVGFALFAWIPS